jgi:hypothetical protein
MHPKCGHELEWTICLHCRHAALKKWSIRDQVTEGDGDRSGQPICSHGIGGDRLMIPERSRTRRANTAPVVTIAAAEFVPRSHSSL